MRFFFRFICCQDFIVSVAGLGDSWLLLLRCDKSVQTWTNQRVCSPRIDPQNSTVRCCLEAALQAINFIHRNLIEYRNISPMQSIVIRFSISENLAKTTRKDTTTGQDYDPYSQLLTSVYSCLAIIWLCPITTRHHKERVQLVNLSRFTRLIYCASVMKPPCEAYFAVRTRFSTSGN